MSGRGLSKGASEVLIVFYLFVWVVVIWICSFCDNLFRGTLNKYVFFSIKYCVLRKHTGAHTHTHTHTHKGFKKKGETTEQLCSRQCLH